MNKLKKDNTMEYFGLNIISRLWVNIMLTLQAAQANIKIISSNLQLLAILIYTLILEVLLAKLNIPMYAYTLSAVSILILAAAAFRDEFYE